MEKILQTPSGQVHYWISDVIDNQKRTLFFLHGLTANHKLFSQQIAYFKDDFNIITWDAPAHGKSRPFVNFTYEKAAIAASDILDENHIEKAVFIGQSMGGFITQSVIKRFPDKVSAFVSVDSTPFGEAYYSKSDRWWLRQIEWMAKLYPDSYLRSGMMKQCALSEHAAENMRSMLSDYPKNELCHLMGIGFAGFLEDNCDLEITCPVLLIVGRQDHTGKVQKYNKEWARNLGIQITWIDQAAHNANDDQPKAVNHVIEQFLKECGA